MALYYGKASYEDDKKVKSGGTGSRSGSTGSTGGSAYTYVPSGAVQGDDGRLYYRTPTNYYDSTDSGADSALLSKESQAIISKAKEDWLAAQAAGDQAGMDRAHAVAEAERAKRGYSGGANGGAYNEFYQAPLAGASGSPARGGGGGGYYTSRYQDQIDELTQRLLGAGQEQFTYREAPSFVSRYQDQIDALSREILGRDQFSYDPENDPTYQQYRQSYTRGGNRAMQDTLGQVSARTGGMASSYAESAAQQTYDGYMSALADKIPQLQQLAYQMYLDEWNGKRSELSTLQGLEQSDYNQYLTDLSQYNADRNLAYSSYRDQQSDLWRALNSLTALEQAGYDRYRDMLSDSRYVDETAYNRAVYADQTAYDRAVYGDQTDYSRGIYADERDYNRGVYADETAYNRGVYADETDYDRKTKRAAQLAQTGDFSGYLDLGYSEADVARMQAAFRLQHPELAALFYTGGGYGSYTGADQMGNTIYYNNGVGTYSDGTLYYDGTGGSGGGYSAGGSSGGYSSGSGSSGSRSYSGTSSGGTGSGGTGSSGGKKITSTSQLGTEAKRILNHINPTPNYISTQVQKGLKNGTVTEAEAEYLLRAVGY